MAAILCGADAPISRADQPGGDAAAADKVPEGKSTLHRMLDKSAGKYSLYAGADRQKPLKLRCVLRWANLTRGSADGATYIWTRNGRPLATVCVYPWAGRLCDNFQSLAEGPIAAVREGQTVWQCSNRGVEYRPVPDADRPQKSAAERLRQLKSLARDFRTTLLGWNADDSDREELRMLPRPVYRYEPDSAGPLDGAIFAFVQGTDPETFLLLEAAHAGGEGDGDYEWRYALARRTSGKMETRYRGQIVWTAERLLDYSDPKRDYFQFSVPLPADVAGE
ncbi:MAG TPA: hypothetical protein VJ783_00205 [Pirellulales bacterium]|nr:hypothetical protein [Pirellulales bacterium]